MGWSEPPVGRLGSPKKHTPTPHDAGPGLTFLVPGLTQFGWGQRERGLVLLLSFLTAAGTTLFCWGNPLSWGFFGFAFVTHILSTLDVLRQRAFPAFPTGLALVSVLTTALLLYAPVGVMLRICALPASTDDAPGVGFLVNSLAYQGRRPEPGEWIWLRPSAPSVLRAGRVLAVADQEVAWVDGHWKVADKALTLIHPGSLPYFPSQWKFVVPARHVLIAAETTRPGQDAAPPLQIVAEDQIVGRIWARYYPLWDRCLL